MLSPKTPTLYVTLLLTIFDIFAVKLLIRGLKTKAKAVGPEPPEAKVFMYIATAETKIRCHSQ